MGLSENKSNAIKLFVFIINILSRCDEIKVNDSVVICCYIRQHDLMYLFRYKHESFTPSAPFFEKKKFNNNEIITLQTNDLSK